MKTQAEARAELLAICRAMRDEKARHDAAMAELDRRQAALQRECPHLSKRRLTRIGSADPRAICDDCELFFD